MQGVGGEDDGVSVRRSEPAELRLDLIRADPGGLQDRCTLGELRDRGGSGRAGRAALTVEGDARDPSLVRQQGDPDQVAAGRTPGGSAERSRRDGPATAIVGDVLLEEVPVHALKLRRLQPAVCRPGLVTRVA